LYSVDRSARELLDLITAMLDLSRLEAGRLPLAVSPVDVVHVLAEVRQETQVLQEQSQLAFVWQVDEPRLVVQTDPQHLKVILKNLLGNAMKYTEARQITITAQGHVGGVEIQIVDTGIGIAPEALSQIFEPFYQVDNPDRRKRGGVGLGLHIVRRLIERLGGRVDVESEVGRGTTFRVRIPLSPSAIL
jgi:signal transduction histidine kinase